MEEEVQEVEEDGWNDIVKEKIVPKPPITCEKGRHLFRQTGSREAKCISCPLGYILDPGMSVMDGHIYKGDDIVI